MARHIRWLQLIAFAGLLAPFSAGATSKGMAPLSSQAGTTGGISTGGGPVMTGRVNVYLIWYGTNFPAWSQTESIVEYFISNWGASHSYGVLRNYTGSNGRVAPQLALASVTTASGKTSLTDSDVQTIVSTAIQNGFPLDPNGIYVVIVGRGISVNGGSIGNLCTGWCAYHSRFTYNSVDIKYTIDGSGDCSSCSILSTPNNDLYADQMVNALAHEIAETVTDPDFNAWGNNGKNEVGDKCNNDFSERHPDPNGVQTTAKVGMAYYTLQKLWSPTAGGGCYSGYAPPAAVIWQQGPGGAIGAWKMKDQNTVAAYLIYNNIPLGQNVLAVGDFSNGIDPQVLTIDSSGNGPVTMWTLHGDGTTDTSAVMFSGLGSGWKVTATGDFNGDGFSDILFTNPSSGDNQLYLMQGTTLLNWQDLGSFLPWLPQGVADVNGDGLADIFWVDSPDQLYSVWASSLVPGSSVVSFIEPAPADMSSANFGHPTHGILAVGDFNGDSRADVLYYPADWTSQGDGDGILTADFILWPFENVHNWVANSILPDSPVWSGIVDVNRDGTSDFYMQTSAGIQFFTMGDWKWIPPVYGPLLNSPTLAAEEFAVIGTSPAMSDTGWVVVGTGGFKEN